MIFVADVHDPKGCRKTLSKKKFALIFCPYFGLTHTHTSEKGSEKVLGRLLGRVLRRVPRKGFAMGLAVKRVLRRVLRRVS